MRAVIQAVSSASVRVNGGEPRPIGPGLVILLGVKDTDTLDIVPKLAEKCAGLRIFKDENDKLNLSAKDLGYSALVVSQFTLYGDTKKGFRPSFIKAAKPPLAVDAYELFLAEMNRQGLKRRPARRVRRRYAGVAGQRGPLHHRHRHRRVAQRREVNHEGISSGRPCAVLHQQLPAHLGRRPVRWSSTPPQRCRSTTRS